MVDHPDQPLRDDVRRLGALLGETLARQESPALLERVERVRQLAKQSRQDPPRSGADPFERLATELRAMPVDDALPVARSFAHFLNLANIAEQHHRIRRRRAYELDAQSKPQPASIEETCSRLVANGMTPQDLWDAIGRLRIELVITAHPTEIMRRTLQHKYSRIAEGLADLDRPDLTPVERETFIEAIRREITTAWETEDVRRERPSPLDEVRSAMAVFEETIWDAVPQYLRSLERTLLRLTGRELPLDLAPIRFGSWIGGDRDGNPAVTPDVTWRACLMARWTALWLYAREIESLRFELSIADASAELQARARGAHEPYRAVLRELQQRVTATLEWIESALASAEPGAIGDGSSAALLHSADDLAEPLRLCYRSLCDTGNRLIAQGRLTDVLRRVATFGLNLVRLDVRQEADRHAEALDAVTTHLGLGRYLDWSETERVDFLQRSLAQDRPSDVSGMVMTPRVTDVVATFRKLAEINSESLGAYVITRAGQPSDVLAVEWLQRHASISPPMRVVPLFETARDLEAAAGVMRGLFAIPWYHARLAQQGGRQEVMVGYSDSAKEVGRLGAAWVLYQAQESIVAACRDEGVPVTLFHGRGGSVGRGGGPTHLAIRSQPPGSVDGTLRVTEQGEMIQAKFGLPGIALRTLEVYTTATLEAAVTPAAPIDPQWRVTMARLSSAATAAYRRTVYEDPRFVPYYRSATPEAELDAMHIGSRPASRTGSRSLQDLRAIPWQFAWMQTRLLLPSWLGVEELVGEALDDADRDVCRAMYRDWPFYRSTIDLIEMALAKSDAGIAAHYDRQLVPEALRDLGHSLRDRLELAIRAVLDTTRHAALLDGNPVLRRSIGVRNPYVDPINLLQVELLRRLRNLSGPDAQADAARLRGALLVTINGIAAGMRNTG